MYLLDTVARLLSSMWTGQALPFILRVCAGGQHRAGAFDRRGRGARGGMAADSRAPGAAQLGVCDPWSLECA